MAQILELYIGEGLFIFEKLEKTLGIRALKYAKKFGN